MKRTIIFALVFGVVGFCQTTPDAPAAKGLLQQTISAMSAAPNAPAVRDFSLAGSMQIADSEAMNPVRILSRGTDDMRLDITMSEGGTHSVAFLRGRGRMRDRPGKEVVLSSASRAGTDIAFLPTPGMLADILDSARQITDLGSDLVNGRAVRRIVVSRQYSKEKDPLGVMTARSKTEFFIDAESFLILKIRNIAYDARGQKSSQRELTFSDYRAVNGVILPFSIAESSDGQKSWAITVESLDLNPKLTDADFKL
jgi:hypothetical protein